MKSLLSALLALLCSHAVLSQNLQGKVVDTSGEPIPAASIFIQETRQGLVCNLEGEFRTKLVPGTYHCEFRCMGYEAQEKEVTIGSEDVTLNVVLTTKDMKLNEVVVNFKEDPAYAIMRKVIEKAPYYQSIIKASTYEAYTKGSGKMKSIPKIAESMAGDELKIYKDKLFLQESFSEIKFTAPDQYEQTIKAYSSSMPDSEDPKEALGINMISLYRPMFGPVVSPLNPRAFSYYKFRYEGYEEENGQMINKIKFTPKLKDPRFLEGYLYIADDEWNIRHAEMTAHPNGMTVNYTFNYHPVMENIYLVTTYEVNLDANMLGFKFSADFLSSIQYTDIQLNDSLVALEISRKGPEKKKKSLEIKWDENHKKEVDSLATKRDSLYWQEMRNVVLNEEEISSYARKDSLQSLSDSIKQKQLHPEFNWMDVLTGGRIGGDSAKVSLKYDGLLQTVPEYNFVDGMWIGESFSLNIKRNKNSGWKITPMAYWAWSRKQLLWNMDVRFTYAPMRLGELRLSGGSITKDYNANKGMLRIENALYSVFAGINNAKLYQNDYFRIENEIDLANGIQLGTGIEIADRKTLQNHTTYSFFGDEKDAKPNIPPYPSALNSQYNALAQYEIRLKYTPEYYYSVENGKKEYIRSRFPTFQLLFMQGVPSWLDNSRFYRIDLSISQNIKLGLFDRLQYAVNAGKFFNDNAFNYIDYKHFNGADQLFSGKLFENSFALLDYYTFSTNKNWVQAFANYDTQYLLIKRLPFLQGKLFSESLHAKFLHTPDKKYYSEWGYSVGLPGRLASAGVFVSFDSFDYNSVGFRVSFPLLHTLEKLK